FENKELIKDIHKKSTERAFSVGLMDYLTAGFASKVVAPSQLTSTAAQQAANLPVQVAAQAGGGAAGEALAQIVSEGDVTAPGEVVAEAAGELVTGPLEVAAAIQATKEKK